MNKRKKKSSPMVPVACNLHFSFKVCSHYLLISLRIPHHHLGVFWPLYKGDAKRKARPYFHNPKKPAWLASEAPACPLSVASFLYFVFWLWWVFLAARWLSLVAVSRGALCCDVRTHWGGCSCGAQAPSVRASAVAAVAAHGPRSWGTQA